MKLVFVFMLMVILIVLLYKRQKVEVKCPAGYSYAPWAASGTACVPIGVPSSSAGISADATRPMPYDTPMFPANRPSDEYYNKNL
jgi:hypothetical protein